MDGVRRVDVLALEPPLCEIGVTSIFTDAMIGRNPEDNPTSPSTIA